MIKFAIFTALTLGFAQSLSASTDVIKLKYECIGPKFSGTLNIDYSPSYYDYNSMNTELPAGMMMLNGHSLANGFKSAKSVQARILAVDEWTFFALHSVRADIGDYEYLIYRFNFNTRQLTEHLQSFHENKLEPRSEGTLIYDCVQIMQP
jgi:hypothetical protein